MKQPRGAAMLEITAEKPMRGDEDGASNMLVLNTLVNTATERAGYGSRRGKKLIHDTKETVHACCDCVIYTLASRQQR